MMIYDQANKAQKTKVNEHAATRSMNRNADQETCAVLSLVFVEFSHWSQTFA